MARPMTSPPALLLPPDPDPARMPIRYATAVQLAEIYGRYYGPIAPRTVRERWPLEWRLMNDRNVASVHDFLAEAQRRFDNALVVRGGCRQRAHCNQAAA